MHNEPRPASRLEPHAGAALLLALSVVGCGPDGDRGAPLQFMAADPNISSWADCSLDGVVYAPEVNAAPATDARPYFSFFATSQAGLYSLPAGEHAPQPDPARGYGGDFGGLAGADEICNMLARRSNPGDQKIWRAFLSSPGTDSEARVDAIGRVGQGPWYDFNGVLFARDLEGLLPNAKGRPRGAASPLGTRFSDENGEEMWQSGKDNHDTLTGSDSCGKLFDDGASGVVASCDGWTSKTLHGKQGNLAGVGGQIPVGHSWPRAFSLGGDAAVGARWINDHTINGCEPGATTSEGAGAPAGDFRVGAGGGFGGFYCFALGATPPTR
jgi:hypothetical protein